MNDHRACDLLVRNADRILTMKGGPPGAVANPDWDSLGEVEGGSIAIRDGRIVAVGNLASIEAVVDTASSEVVDASGATVMPGLIDPHTHFVFAGDRASEYAMRVEGVDYAEIRKRGGGIRSSVNAFREASDGELYENGRKRLDLFLRNGTTTVEGKSGYGLSVKEEIRALDIMGRLDDDHPIEVVRTFLGAHDVPPEFDDRKNDYIDLVCGEMMEAAAPKAEFCDVFCETGYFSVKESRRILTAGFEHGLRPRLHAEEFKPIGGGKLAAELNALSADHLMVVPEEEAVLMAKAGTVAVLLPGTAIGLASGHWADPAKFRKAGQPIALATDCNPGSSYSTSMPLILSLACSLLRMTVPEALIGATRNAAAVLGRSSELGTIESGKRADLILVDAEHPAALPYRFGENIIRTVIKNGKQVL